jgi:Uroporphyrinogen-III synthase HemD
LLLPSASLHARAFSTQNEQEIVAARAFVFPSPFSISASLRRCFELRERANCGPALLAVIGHGSHQALMTEISQLAWDPSRFEIVANTVEPFDAEHLAPKLRESLDALVAKLGKSAASPLNVVLLRGDKSNNDALVWETWLNAETEHRSIKVSEIQAYENRENEVFEQLLAKTQPDTWCCQESVVYFSSSSTVRSFAKALLGARSGARPGARPGLQETPTAITIHPKISNEVQMHLGWKVVEISVGPQALLNWLTQNFLPL